MSRLETSRSALRRSLGRPDPADPQAASHGVFPRSTTMKLLISPEYAWLRVAAVGIATALIAGRRPTRSNGALLAGLAALQRLVTRRQAD